MAPNLNNIGNGRPGGAFSHRAENAPPDVKGNVRSSGGPRSGQAQSVTSDMRIFDNENAINLEHAIHASGLHGVISIDNDRRIHLAFAPEVPLIQPQKTADSRQRPFHSIALDAGIHSYKALWLDEKGRVLAKRVSPRGPDQTVELEFSTEPTKHSCNLRGLLSGKASDLRELRTGDIKVKVTELSGPEGEAPKPEAYFEIKDQRYNLRVNNGKVYFNMDQATRKQGSRQSASGEIPLPHDWEKAISISSYQGLVKLVTHTDSTFMGTHERKVRYFKTQQSDVKDFFSGPTQVQPVLNKDSRFTHLHSSEKPETTAGHLAEGGKLYLRPGAGLQACDNIVQDFKDRDFVQLGDRATGFAPIWKSAKHFGKSAWRGAVANQKIDKEMGKVKGEYRKGLPDLKADDLSARSHVFASLQDRNYLTYLANLSRLEADMQACARDTRMAFVQGPHHKNRSVNSQHYAFPNDVAKECEAAIERIDRLLEASSGAARAFGSGARQDLLALQNIRANLSKTRQAILDGQNGRLDDPHVSLVLYRAAHNLLNLRALHRAFSKEKDLNALAGAQKELAQKLADQSNKHLVLSGHLHIPGRDSFLDMEDASRELRNELQQANSRFARKLEAFLDPFGDQPHTDTAQEAVRSTGEPAPQVSATGARAAPSSGKTPPLLRKLLPVFEDLKPKDSFKLDLGKSIGTYFIAGRGGFGGPIGGVFVNADSNIGLQIEKQDDGQYKVALLDKNKKGISAFAGIGQGFESVATLSVGDLSLASVMPLEISVNGSLATTSDSQISFSVEKEKLEETLSGLLNFFPEAGSGNSFFPSPSTEIGRGQPGAARLNPTFTTKKQSEVKVSLSASAEVRPVSVGYPEPLIFRSETSPYDPYGVAARLLVSPRVEGGWVWNRERTMTRGGAVDENTKKSSNYPYMQAKLGFESKMMYINVVNVSDKHAVVNPILIGQREGVVPYESGTDARKLDYTQPFKNAFQDVEGHGKAWCQHLIEELEAKRNASVHARAQGLASADDAENEHGDKLRDIEERLETLKALKSALASLESVKTSGMEIKDSRKDLKRAMDQVDMLATIIFKGEHTYEKEKPADKIADFAFSRNGREEKLKGFMKDTKNDDAALKWDERPRLLYKDFTLRYLLQQSQKVSGRKNNQLAHDINNIKASIHSQTWLERHGQSAGFQAVGTYELPAERIYEMADKLIEASSKLGSSAKALGRRLSEESQVVKDLKTICTDNESILSLKVDGKNAYQLKKIDLFEQNQVADRQSGGLLQSVVRAENAKTGLLNRYRGSLEFEYKGTSTLPVNYTNKINPALLTTVHTRP
ncbi:hypothetical protein [Martelella mediterranea]|uniref:Uncharacterized protein n=1 Tax=Martelella mediterranea TaxID=293089 RepID=A0A4R3NES9_9HYPH|nr:hypothetical protein [Martelella mediterranea]TCT28798.1 hypothetical protein EDC90_10582 [Martelella mediterranea]